MKKRLSVFFILHFSIVLTLSAYTIITSYTDIHYNKKPNIPVLSFLKHSIYENKYFSNYLILSGINTGYGFYGINTATEKFISLELYDSNRNLIKDDAYFNFSTTSGYSRFKGFASHLANHISETESLLLKKDSTEAGKKIAELQELYTNKIFKWLGKNIARQTLGCAYYKIKLITIVPVNIWKQVKNTIPQIYVYKELEFSAN